LSIQRAKLIDANALGGGRDYQFHTDGIRTLEIRSLGRLAQGVDAVLLLPGGRVGETRLGIKLNIAKGSKLCPFCNFRG